MSATILGALTLVALVGEPDASVPTPATTPAGMADDETTPAPYVQASLGGGGVWGRDSTRTTRGAALPFGIGAGALLQPRPRLRLGLGGAFVQTAHGRAGSGWPSWSTTDLLANVRVGGAGPRVWGYGIGGLGLSIVAEDGGDYFAVHSGPAAQLGLGLRIAFPNRTSLGFEADGTLTFLPPNGLAVRASGSIVLAWRFGARSTRPRRTTGTRGAGRS